MKVVIDTNVLISALFFKGKPLTLIDKVVEGVLECCATKSIIDEYEAIFTRFINKKSASNTFFPAFEEFIKSLNIINNNSLIKVSRDRDDDKFIQCACSSKSKYIISGDKDLLDIKEFNGIKIITVSEFLNFLDEIKYV